VTRASDNQLKTYRYLRYGMILVIVMLAASVLIERADSPCFETSLSAYYHTPAQSIFVGTLVTIAACLIIIRGYTDVEDIFLNLAGMLAPIVAFVPIRGPAECSSTPVPPRVVSADIANNVEALLFVGGVGVVLAIGIVWTSWGQLSGGWRGTRLRRVAGVAAAVAIVAGTWAWYEFAPASFEGEGRVTAHYTAAVAMLVFFGVVVLLNALPNRRGPARGRRAVFVTLYWIILSLMVIIPIAMYLVARFSGWDYAVLVVEVALIGLFAIFWLIQTAELASIDEGAGSPSAG
jgi:hypothetical protein